MQDYEYLLSSLDKIKGIGKKTVKLFLKKKIYTIFDLLWHQPISKIETSKTTNIDDLQIGKTHSIKLIPLKYNFPRIRNLPNRVICLSSEKKIGGIYKTTLWIDGDFSESEREDNLSKTVDYEGKKYLGMERKFDKELQAALVNAIKELSAKNDALEARIAALEG